MFPFSTIGSTTTGDHRTAPLMSLNPLLTAFLPLSQSSSDPPISLCNSTAMSLPLAHLLCGMPSQNILSHVLSINQHISDSTLLVPLLQCSNPSQPDAAAPPPTPGSSAFLSSPLQLQANCLQAFHKTIQQFNQHLKAAHLDRQKLQFIVLQLQNNFALLRYLLFSNKDIAVKNPATSPLLNPNPNFKPTSCTFPLPSTGEPQLPRSTPLGAVGPPRAKTNNSAKVDFQPISNTQESPATTVHNLTSRFSKLEKLFADEISTYTSTTAGIHSQYFSLYDKTRQLEPGNSDVIICRNPQ